MRISFTRSGPKFWGGETHHVEAGEVHDVPDADLPRYEADDFVVAPREALPTEPAPESDSEPAPPPEPAVLSTESLSGQPARGSRSARG